MRLCFVVVVSDVQVISDVKRYVSDTALVKTLESLVLLRSWFKGKLN